MIQEISWDNFGAKFSSNKQEAFKRLCCLLFCKEFNKNIGIFRFRNPAGIETNSLEKMGRLLAGNQNFMQQDLLNTGRILLIPLIRLRTDTPISIWKKHRQQHIC